VPIAPGANLSERPLGYFVALSDPPKQMLLGSVGQTLDHFNGR